MHNYYKNTFRFIKIEIKNYSIIKKYNTKYCIAYTVFLKLKIT